MPHTSCLPIGFASEKNSRAISSLIATTRGDPTSSRSLKSRPDTSGVPASRSTVDRSHPNAFVETPVGRRSDPSGASGWCRCGSPSARRAPTRWPTGLPAVRCILIEQPSRQRNRAFAAIAGLLRIHVEHEQVVRGKPEIDVAQIRDRTKEQPRARQEHERHRPPGRRPAAR